MMRQFWEISTNNSNRECTRIDAKGGQALGETTSGVVSGSRLFAIR
jgi:hypothetical protein